MVNVLWFCQFNCTKGVGGGGGREGEGEKTYAQDKESAIDCLLTTLDQLMRATLVSETSCSRP